MLELADITEYRYKRDSVKSQMMNQKAAFRSSLVTLCASVQICEQKIVHVFKMSNHVLLHVHAIVVLWLQNAAITIGPRHVISNNVAF